MERISTIRGNESVVSICEVLGDKVSYAVLLSVMKSPKSASEISIESNLPISSTYKALKKLQRADLIKASLVEQDGRRLSVYRSKIKMIKLTIAVKETRIDLAQQEPDFNGENPYKQELEIN